MSDRPRWRYGDTNPVVAAVDSGTVIEIGDLVYQDVDDAKPASILPIQVKFVPKHIGPMGGGTNYLCMERMQEKFADNFLGVAMQRSQAGETDPIRVATTGVFELDCPSGTFELGTLVGADENAGGSGLLNQQVAAVDASRYAIGRVAKRAGPAAISVLIDIRSRVMGESI